MNIPEIISSQARHMHEKLNEGIVRTNNDLLITLISSNDYPERPAQKHAAMFNTNTAEFMRAMRTLQGYGYIYIDSREGKNIPVITPKGAEVLARIRSHMKNRP